MSSGEFLTDPFSKTVADASASALLVPEGDSWKVDVVISREPDQPPTDAGELDAMLFDQDGNAMEMTERQHGILPEAGTSLSSSIDATFRFRRTASEPAKLVVIYRGMRADFAIHAR